VHAVPAGHSPDSLKVTKGFDFNICALHAIVKGTAYHNGTIAEDGLPVSSFDKKGFDVVVAGDNHKQQEIKGLTDCRGFSIGAPMQHNWGDEGADRGYMHIVLGSYRHEPETVLGFQYKPTKHPKFMKVDWAADDLEQIIFAAKHGVDSWR
jgi:DNA repair exonuclease SbcCD nuclease subunit